MAKTKDELLAQAVAAGVLPDDATTDAYTAAELAAMTDPERPAWEGSRSATEPIIAADGHVVLSQEDIDARAV